MVTIAVDAMGSDQAPVPEVEGAIAASRELGHRILLVGDKETVEKQLVVSGLKHHADINGLPVEVVHAPDRITMDDHAAKAARGKRESSMHICARLVAGGTADGYVSAGNTGACMASASMSK